MNQTNNFTKQQKLELIEGEYIFSRDKQITIGVSNSKFVKINNLGSYAGLPYVPTKEEVDRLCDDMFYEEFHCEPSEANIKSMADKVFDIKNYN